ncbi:DUF4233 domain-containing protein [Amycolatopsis palatopharyngis]|uniref:DUF4233 domain-containing protein n=1 Tax=Amycolatopsis palatopharyngis TaxID=187982 RepID=UPI000E26FFE1|nr:DUF4233 domain-containing protein [Amycolatopsis palatopharyngis]
MSEAGDAAPESPESQPSPAPAKDPMKSFRGIMAGTLVMESIAVALALPVVAKLGGGVASWQGWTVIAVAVAMLLLCGALRRAWAIPAVFALHVVLLAFVVAVPAIAIIGMLFLALWLWLFWLRRDVARRMAEGRLPSQQSP